MEFKKYMHIERFGTTEVQNIEFGKCFIFPKIDGTNGSLWYNNGLQAGSRRRHLTSDKDNAGFYNWANKQENIYDFLNDNKDKRLFGEWLVPHSLKTYKEDAWSNFYVFDVSIDTGDDLIYLDYDNYKLLLDKYNINYIPPICIIKNGSYEQFVNQLEKNIFLIDDGKGAGEGIVIKNYNFINRFGRMAFAKIITSEFKKKHAKEMGVPEIKGKKNIEEEVAKKYTTKALCDKVFSKIKNESGFSSKQIPQLLNTVFYDVIKEESWDIIKKYKNPTINYKTLQHFVYSAVKENLPEIFN